MKRKFTKKVQTLCAVFVIALLSFGSTHVMGQQFIGSFPTMDGGFEGETVGALTQLSIPAATQVPQFTCEGNNGAGIQTSIARTGTKSVNIYYSGSSTKRMLQSPTAGAGLVTAQPYTIQYYYRTQNAIGTGAMMQVGVNISGTSGATPKYFPSSAPFSILAGTSGVWTKAAFTTATPTGTPSASTYGIGIIRASAASNPMGVSIDVDDFVMYAGAVDVTAPDPATSPSATTSVATQMTVSWTAPATGVDGGGYMVVRGLADPTTTPNPNGIYAIGNTVAPGEQVVYIGTGNSFIDTGLTPVTTYYYRIYTVDKAFNYSTPLTVNSAPIAIDATALTNAGFTANWIPVSGATAYDLNVYSKSGIKTTEGFDAVGTTATPVPADWTFTNIGTTYTSTGYFNTASPSLKFDATGEIVTTPTYAAPATAISFWIKGASTDATSALLVEGSVDGITWSTIENINPIPTTGTLKTYNATSTPILGTGFVKFRFTYNQSAGNVAFDDFTYISNYSEDAITGSPFTGITGTSFAITGLQRGATYYYKVTARNATATSLISNELKTTTANYLMTIADGLWSTPGTWADGNTPPAGSQIVINNAVVLDQNTSVTDLIINAGQSLSVNAGKHLTASSTFTNNGTLNLLADATGTATILTPTTITTGTAGTYKVQQYLASAGNWYISSPVGDALAPTGYTFYKYDEPGNNTGYTSPATAYWESVASGAAFNTMTGYLVPTSGAATLEFSGVNLNAGTKSINLTRQGALKTGFNLVGNPYPSYLDWAIVSAANTGITATVWYRTRTSSDVPVFETYNASGVHTNLGATAVSSRIPPMQAFWVRANTDGATFAVNNTMWAHADFAPNSLKAPAMQINKQPALHLIVSNGSNRDEVVFYANANASNGFDAYDSPKMWNEMNSIPEIYTMVGSEQLAINGMNSIPLNAEFLLGFKTGEANVFNIKASEISNLASDVRVILKDKAMNTEFDLTDGFAYTFASGATFTNGRFSIIFRSGPVTSVPTATGDQNLLVYRNANNQIAVQIKGQPNDSYSVDVFNSVGKKLVSKLTSTGITVIDTPLSSGVYFVTIKGSGNNTAKKVIID